MVADEGKHDPGRTSLSRSCADASINDDTSVGYRRPSRRTSRCWCSWSLSTAPRARRTTSGTRVMLLVGLFAATMPVIHMRGAHYSEIARSPAASSSSDSGARRPGGRHPHPVSARWWSLRRRQLRGSHALPHPYRAGGACDCLGAVALSVKKGGNVHRRSGLLFVYAMLVMGASASILSLRNDRDSGMSSRSADGVFRRDRSHDRTPHRPGRAASSRCSDSCGRLLSAARWRSEVERYARCRSGRCPIPDRGVMS